MLTTGTPDQARALSAKLEPLGLRFLDVGVQTAPDDIGTPKALLIYSGSEEGFAAHRDVLETLGPTTWLGDEPGAAALWDLALFGLWYDAQVGLLRALDLVPSAAGREAFAHAAAKQLQHVVDEAPDAAAEITGRDYPRGPATLAEHLPVVRSSSKPGGEPGWATAAFPW